MPLCHFRADSTTENSLDEFFIGFFTDDVYYSVFNCRIKISITHILENIGFCDRFRYSFSMLRWKLRTVLPIHFITVVFLGVMGCRYIYAGDTVVFQYGEGKLWRRTQGIKKIYLYIICSKHPCCCSCKKLRIFTAVISDGDTSVYSIAFHNKLRKPPCGMCHGIYVHS